MGKTEYLIDRQRAGVPQHAAAAEAHVSPTLTRAFERFGPAAVTDPQKLERLLAVYAGFRRRAA